MNLILFQFNKPTILSSFLKHFFFYNSIQLFSKLNIILQSILNQFSLYLLPSMNQSIELIILIHLPFNRI